MRRSQPRRRIAIVTGTRAEYGLLRTIMDAVDRHPGLHLQLVVTGMHLIRKFGFTVNDIVREGRTIDARIKMQRGDESPTDQAEGLARGLQGMARYFIEAKTDLVVVLGDRVEAMAGALAAVTTGKVLCHIHGGDIAPGDLDESFRHAITKLSHLHLTGTKRAAKRIARMGEDETRIHFVGAPGLDRIVQLVPPGRRRSVKTGRALVVQHPCGRSVAYERRLMSSLLHAVDAANLTPVVIYPNSDRGHTGIVSAIESYRSRRRRSSARIVRSLGHDEYLRLLADSDLLVGNSSSGIIEAAAVGTPSVNVGGRQEGRERGGNSIVDCAETGDAIAVAITQAIKKRPITGGNGVYGDGRSGRRMADIVAKVRLTPDFLRKQNTY